MSQMIDEFKKVLPGNMTLEDVKKVSPWYIGIFICLFICMFIAAHFQMYVPATFSIFAILVIIRLTIKDIYDLPESNVSLLWNLICFALSPISIPIILTVCLICNVIVLWSINYIEKRDRQIDHELCDELFENPLIATKEKDREQCD